MVAWGHVRNPTQTGAPTRSPQGVGRVPAETDGFGRVSGRIT